jgi:hypothetical protein
VASHVAVLYSTSAPTPAMCAVLQLYLLRPTGGTMSTPSSAASARSRRSPPTRPNHCIVPRRMIGCFVRQSYGYLPRVQCKRYVRAQ